MSRPGRPRSLLARAMAICLAPLLACTQVAIAAEPVVNVYSYREPKLIEPLLAKFTAATGIKANVLFAGSGLIERMTAEGANSPADLLLTNEFGLLIQAKLAGVTQPLVSEALDSAIPAAYRDADHHWFGLTRRARVVMASRARVAQDAITYEELADPKWKGRICMRSGQYTYNTALFASMIAALGEAQAEVWLAGVKANLARRPSGGDRDQVRNVYAGLCDIAIANTYYIGARLADDDQRAWAASVKVLFPNSDARGTHVNISGAALAANAPHKQAAIRLLEFLASPGAQKIYAEVNYEYPIVAGVEPSELLRSFGPLRADPLPLAEIANLRRKASELADKVRFDAGPRG